MKVLCVLLLSLIVRSGAAAQASRENRSSVSGRVLDQEGNTQPSEIQLFQFSIHDGFGDVYPICSTTTNQEGQFECPKLPHGQFLLKANPAQIQKARSEVADRGTPELAPTYYPGVDNLGSSMMIPLKDGEAAWAELRLAATGGTDIAGTLTSHSRGAALTLKATANGFSVESGIPVQYDSATGRFNAHRVPEGDYILTADWFAGAGEHRSAVPISVGNAPVQNLDITSDGDAVVYGELAQQADTAHVTELRLSRIDGTSPDVASTVKDGRFTFKNVPTGDYLVELPANETFYVDGIASGGRVSDGPRISVGSSPDGIEIQPILKTPTVEIDGLVEEVSSEPAEVVARAEETGQIYKVMSDKLGRFRLGGLKPGEYHLYAWPRVDMVEYRNPQILNRYDQDSTEVTVEQGNLASTVSLSLIEKMR